MDWKELVLAGVGAGLLGVAGHFGRMLATLIKTLIGKIKHQSLQQGAWVVVRAAEKLIKGRRGGKKKLDYAISRLTKKFPWASQLKLTEFVESAVQAMRAETGNGASSRTKP
jgi:hypothetical protein